MASRVSRAAARRYARALFDVAVREGDVVAAEREVASFSDAFQRNPLLRRTMRNPVFPAARKQAVVAELARLLALGPIVSKLLDMLAAHHSLELLPALLEAYQQRLMEHQGVVRADVITAAPLTEDRAQAVARGLAAATGKRVTMTSRVDPAIIGGVVARIGSTVFDGSLTRQLELIREKMIEGAW
jgi:F-type H+-transporting ATPase subunit delta